VKSPERLAEHNDLTQQVWWMMPAEVDRKRAGSHPAPFPELLPARLIKLFTFGAVAPLGTDASGFAGEIVADPFVGTGTTCVAAKRMGRRFIGIDRVEKYAAEARERIVAHTALDGGPMLLVSTPKQQGRSTLEAAWKSLQAVANLNVISERKHVPQPS
jgi:hypothetical protein